MKNLIARIKQNWPHTRKMLLGSGSSKGILYTIAVYFLSITFAFVFLYPIFYMFMISLMSNTDLVDSTIMWIPSSIYFNNYVFSARGLLMNQTYAAFLIEFFKNADSDGISQTADLFKQLSEPEVFTTPLLTELLKLITVILIVPGTWLFGQVFTNSVKKITLISVGVVAIIFILPVSYVNSFYVAGSTTFMTMVSSAIIGYGLGRFKFKGKNIIFVLMILVYILPKTLLFIPRAEIFNEIGIKGTMFALWLPSILGQGVQATFFILIFFQFFKMVPDQIEESAYIDGASAFQVFVKIALPMAVPAFIIAITYGFAVTWNEVFISNFYLEGNVKTIPMLLGSLQDEWGRYADYTSGDAVNVDFTESKAFAGTLLSIIPLVVAYGFIQKYFIESIDKSGITGE
jgi:multiple sugar transport system permease protein